MVEHAKFRIFHLCEHCNEEFEIPVKNYEDISGVTIAIPMCPNCKKGNNIWIRIPGDSYRNQG